MNTTSLIVAAILVFISAGSKALTSWSEGIVTASTDLIRNESTGQDVNILSAPDIVRPGEDVEILLESLVSQGYLADLRGQCKGADADELSRLKLVPTRSICRTPTRAFIRQPAPLPAFIFRLKRQNKKLVVDSILDQNGSGLVFAELYSQPRAIFKLDADGRIGEQIRQVLMVSPSDLDTDTIKMAINEENARVFTPWFQGTDWIGVIRAMKANVRKGVGLGGDNYQGGTSLIEQYAKAALLDPSDPPPPKSDLSAGHKKDRIYHSIGSLYRYIKRRVLSAYLAEALLQRFSRQEMLLRALNATSYGVEQTNVRSGRLNQGMQVKESIQGPKTAAQALFSKNIDQLTAIEQAAIAVAPRDPSVLRLLQKPKKEADHDAKKTAKALADFVSRLKIGLERYADELDSKGQPDKAENYRRESKKIPPSVEGSIQQQIARLQSLIPSLRVNEDDRMGTESLQLLERESLRKEVADYLAAKQIEYARLKNLKITVVSTSNKRLERDISSVIEGAAPGLKGQFDKSLAGRKSDLDFEILLETIVSDQDGRIMAAASVRSDNGKVIPNRSYLNYPAFLGSTAKPINNTAALSEGRITLDTVVCSSQAISPNGYTYDDIPADKCMSIGEGLSRSVNWVQIVVRNLMGPDLALEAWSRASGQPIKYPVNFARWPKIDQDKWTYEQARGANAEPVSKSVLDAVALYTTMAHSGQRSDPSFIRKMWIGSDVIEPKIRTSQVFAPTAVAEISALLQQNGRVAFNLGDASPAVKTGSLTTSYWNIAWSRNLVLVSRVVIIIKKDATTDQRLRDINLSLAEFQADPTDDNKRLAATLVEERNGLVREKEKRQNRFSQFLKEWMRSILARDVIQPVNQKIVLMLFQKQRPLFEEPAP